MKAALKEAIEQIKSAGFSHIKVELEGDIGRDGEKECDYCEGSGREDCSNCEGNGYLTFTDDIGNDYEPECMECYGDGYRDCDDCEGTGNTGEYMEEETCENFMRDWVRERNPEIINRLTYGRFYEDGSVDSEFTFTLPIEHIEDVLVWMDSFKALAEESGNGDIDVSGAGLHITVLPEESGGRYPVDEYTLSGRKVSNFTSEVTKLMPALFFLASSGHQSRDLNYRHPRIGEDKYNAISTHSASCFEFRVFETCYDKPETFYDYIKVIANTLKFYADPTLKVKALGKKFGFNDGDECARFYNTPEQLRILNSTVKHLKPKDKTFKRLKEERGVKYTIKSLATKEKVKIQQLREEYREYRRRWIETHARPLTDEEKAQVDYLMLVDEFTRNQAEEEIRARRGMAGGALMTVEDFIKRNLFSPNYNETVNV